MKATFSVYNGGTFLYSVPCEEAYIEAGVWIERGYKVEIDKVRGYITIKK